MKDDLRPHKLQDMVGQTSLIHKLQVCISSALERQEPLDHMLLYGPPGLGKTTLCSLIAEEMGTRFIAIAAPQLKDIKVLSSIVLNLKRGDVFFVDELHRLSISLEESLYGCIEDFKFPIISGGSVITIDLPKFTFCGATTRGDLLSAPIRSRFPIKESLDFYTDEELLQVLKRATDILNIKIEDTGLKEIAKRSRGTPRIANNLLKRVRDFGVMEKEDPMKLETVLKALATLKIDPMGLTEQDRKYLYELAVRFKGGPTGLSTLAAALSEPEDVLVETIEPYLMRCGLIELTSQGRKIRTVEVPMKETS